MWQERGVSISSNSWAYATSGMIRRRSQLISLEAPQVQREYGRKLNLLAGH
jgi:hypothetical protein